MLQRTMKRMALCVLLVALVSCGGQDEDGNTVADARGPDAPLSDQPESTSPAPGDRGALSETPPPMQRARDNSKPAGSSNAPKSEQNRAPEDDRQSDSGTPPLKTAKSGDIADDPSSRPAKTPPSTKTQDQRSNPSSDSINAMPWAVRLGIRVERVNRTFPVVDQVVLVPDAATLVDEVGRWSIDGRWPVLIEDEVYAPMFIRSFKPARVIRRASAGALPNVRAERQALIEQTIVRIWGGNDETMRPAEVFAQRGHIPPGIVLASMDDRAWTAAFVLAAGRGQPIGWLDGNFGTLNQVLPAGRSTELIAAVEQRLNDTGLAFDALGDDLETITLCRHVAARMEHPPRAGAKPVPTAVTDLLGRHASNDRYAMAGWIFGDEARANYNAMCSLFLDRQNYWLVNTYGREGNWGKYAFDELIPAFEKRGWTIVQSLEADELSEADWLRLLPRGVQADVILMNSKGNADFFDVAQGGRMRAGDIPILHTPAALQMIHSWSLRSPAIERTVGAQWLERGVYAYVGSVEEPQLSAFVPAGPLAERLTRGVPFLIACRYWEGRQMVQTPWKINTIGDPLMICRPPAIVAERAAPEPTTTGDELSDIARALLEQIRDQPDDREVYVKAIAVLELLGRDEMILNVWQLAMEAGHGDAAAPGALPAMFRLRDREQFMNAYAIIDQPSERHKTMLWHLMLPELGAAPDAELLVQFTRSLRSACGPYDLERIATRVKSVLGLRHLQRLVDEQLATAHNDQVRRRLQRLLR